MTSSVSKNVNNGPIVAIVGRPNVGKSTLINRIVGQRMAIVHDEPGVTRDRAYYPAQWQDFDFTIVDTGGIMGINMSFDDDIKRQVDIAVGEAEYILFVTDGKLGLVASDTDIAQFLRRNKKKHQKLFLLVNKLDSPPERQQVHAFYELGLGEPIAISALHGDTSIGTLLEGIRQDWQEQQAETIADTVDEVDEILRIAFVGKPNVGKSSIVNALLGETRTIVSDVAGTTRDAIDTRFTVEGKEYILVDTAGIRKRSKVDYGVEMFSVDRAFQAMDRANVIALVLDAESGISLQEKRLADKIRESGKPTLLIINKWDAVPDKKTNSTKLFEEKIVRRELPHLVYAPVLFCSALKNQRLDKIIPNLNFVYANANRRVSTATLNQLLADAVALSSPKPVHNKTLKLYYATQVNTHPPRFVLFVNDEKFITDPYKRYLERRLRENIEFTGTPLVVEARTRERVKGEKR